MRGIGREICRNVLMRLSAFSPRSGENAHLSFRSLALWTLGYPESALASGDRALQAAREIGDAATLMFALYSLSFTHILCGAYATANGRLEELLALAEDKGALYRKAIGMLERGWLFLLAGKVSEAKQIIISGLTAYRSTGATLWTPSFLSGLALAWAELGQFDDARR
jgi:tetratricopeptide (TPR) repeat protein